MIDVGVRARHLLEQAHALLRKEQPRKAAEFLARALDMLGDVDGADRALRTDTARAFVIACELGRCEDLLAQRRVMLFNFGIRKGPVAEVLIRGLARQARRTDLEAAQIYILYLESNPGSDPRTIGTLLRLLARALRVVRTTPPAESAAMARLLDRLHRLRPEDPFPRLFLARHHCARAEFDRAEALLAGVNGSAAQSPKVVNLRGYCAEKGGRSDDAVRHYLTSLHAHPDQAETCFRLGRLLLTRARAQG